MSQVDDSRQWNFSDIKEVKHEGPYKLTIVPFTGDKYTFSLAGQGMSSDDYQTLVERVTAARVQNK